MADRIQLTGANDSGPVWVWPAHIAAMFVRGSSTSAALTPFTCINVVGAADPVIVTESPDEVLDLIDQGIAGWRGLLA